MSINLYKKKTDGNNAILEEILSKDRDTVANKPLIYDSTNDNVKSTDDLNVNTVTANVFCGDLDGTASNSICFAEKTCAEWKEIIKETCVDNAACATTATNLDSAPQLAVGTVNCNKITVTAGNQKSEEFTVPYSTHSCTSSTSNNTYCFDGKTYAQACSDILSGCAADSAKFADKDCTEWKEIIKETCVDNADNATCFNGNTYVCACADILSGTANNATCFAENTCTQWKNIIKTTCVDNAASATNATCFGGCTYVQACSDIRNGLANQACVDFIQSCVTAIEDKIPAEASASNQLADKDFVNSSIATNTANFRGTYACVACLPTTGNTNNDYAFVCSLDTCTGNYIYDRYKWVGSDSCWVCEYELNTTGFTACQLAAINSGITDTLVAKITDVYDNKVTVCMNGLCKGSFNLNQNVDTSIDLGCIINNATCFNDKTYSEVCADILTGNAESASNVMVQQACNNEEKNIAFLNNNIATGTKGKVQFDSDKKITYNPSTNILTVPTVCGNLCGNVTGNLTGNANTASSATNATCFGGKTEACWCGIIKSTKVDCATCADSATSATSAGSATTAASATNSTCFGGCTYAQAKADIRNYTPASATNATCFNGCTYSQACADIRSGLISDVGINVYCGSTCKCTLNKSSNLCLGSNAFNSTAFTTCTGTVTSVTVNGVAGTGTGAVTVSNVPACGGTADCSNAVKTSPTTCNGTCYVTLSANNTDSNKQIYTNANFTYNPSTGELSAKKVTVGKATGDIFTIGSGGTYKTIFCQSSNSNTLRFCQGSCVAQIVNGCFCGNLCGTATSATSATNSTCFGGCTYAQACADIRSGLIGDACFDVYCGATCKCQIKNGCKLCLSANAFNSNATISTTTYPGACCTGTSNYVVTTKVCCSATADSATNSTCFGGCTYACAKADIRNYTPSAATNATCFNGCTYAQACSNIRSGLTSCTGTVTVSNSTSTQAIPVALCTGATSIGKSNTCALTFNPSNGMLGTRALYLTTDASIPNIYGVYQVNASASTQYPVTINARCTDANKCVTNKAFKFCSDGYMYGNVCGNLCGTASQICINLATTGTYNVPLSASGYIYASNACSLTFNPATGVLTAACFCGAVSAPATVCNATTIQRRQATTGTCHLALFSGKTAETCSCTYVSNACALTYQPATGVLTATTLANACGYVGTDAAAVTLVGCGTNNVKIETGSGCTLSVCNDDLGFTNILCIFEPNTIIGYCASIDASDYQTAIGCGATTSGESTTALGDTARACNDCATAIGANSLACVTGSVAVGYRAQACGYMSTALGLCTKALADYATAIGSCSFACGTCSLAIGQGSSAGVNLSIAIGRNAQTVTYGLACNNISIGSSSTTGGVYTISWNEYTLSCDLYKVIYHKYISCTAGLHISVIGHTTNCDVMGRRMAPVYLVGCGTGWQLAGFPAFNGQADIIYPIGPQITSSCTSCMAFSGSMMIVW